MKQLYFTIILLFFPIWGLSQSDEFFDRKKMSDLLVKPDSLLNISIMNYAKEKGYLQDRDIQAGGYDSAEVYLIKQAEAGAALDIYLFTIPSYSSHPDWGILIKTGNDIVIYSTDMELAPVVLKLCDMAGDGGHAFSSRFISETVYKILSYVNLNTEIKHECFDNNIYYYQISDWVHIFKKNEADYVGLWKKAYNKKYDPVEMLKMKSVSPYPILNNHIKSWIRTSYKREIPYQLYQVSPSSHTRGVYFVETNHGCNKSYDLLFREDDKYIFYRIDNLFIPLLHELKGYIKEESTLLHAMKTISLSYMYYYYCKE